jgi:hypothetical protein
VLATPSMISSMVGSHPSSTPIMSPHVNHSTSDARDSTRTSPPARPLADVEEGWTEEAVVDGMDRMAGWQGLKSHRVAPSRVRLFSCISSHIYLSVIIFSTLLWNIYTYI